MPSTGFSDGRQVVAGPLRQYMAVHGPSRSNGSNSLQSKEF